MAIQKDEFFRINEGQQIFQLASEGVRGFGTPEEFKKAGGEFGMEKIITAEEALGLGVPQAAIPKTSTEIIPSELTEGGFQLPPTKPINLEDSLIASIHAQAEQDRVRFEAAEKKQAELEKQAETAFAERPSKAQAIEAQFTKFGITPELVQGNIALAKQIGTANMEMASLQEQKAATIEAAMGRPLPMGILSAEAQKIEDRFNRQINAKAAQAGALAVQLQAQQGNITQARQLASDVINASTADFKVNLDRINTFIELNSATISRLDVRERQAINDLRQTQIDQIKQVRKEKEGVMDIVIRAAEQGINLGINPLTTSLEDAIKIFQAKVSPVVVAKKGENGGGIKFTETQINKGASNAEMKIADFKLLDVDTQNYFINNESTIKAAKKVIDEAKSNKENPSDIEKEINESNKPQEVKDLLIKYLSAVFPKPSATTKKWRELPKKLWEFWK